MGTGAVYSLLILSVHVLVIVCVRYHGTASDIFVFTYAGTQEWVISIVEEGNGSSLFDPVMMTEIFP